MDERNIIREKEEKEKRVLEKGEMGRGEEGKKKKEGARQGHCTGA